MEAALYREYRELRKTGLKVKGCWFITRGRQLLDELEPEASFQFSSGWFVRFKSRHKISHEDEDGNKGEENSDPIPGHN